MRKANQSTVFLAGLFIAAFVSIPILNLATPLFGTAFMVHMHKRLSGRASSPPLIEGERGLGYFGSDAHRDLGRAVGFRDHAQRRRHRRRCRRGADR